MHSEVDDTAAPSPRRTRMARSAVALGLAVGLVAGGAAGAVLGTPTLSGANDEPASAEPAAPVEPAEPAPRERRAERLARVLAPLVESGTLTQAQADAVIEALLADRPERANGGPGKDGHDRRGRHGGPWGGHGLFGALGIDAGAAALDMTPEELREALRSGESLAAIARERGVDVDGVVDALLAGAAEWLDRRVASEDLTRAEADEKLAALRERITAAIERPLRPPHRHGG